MVHMRRPVSLYRGCFRTFSSLMEARMYPKPKPQSMTTKAEPCLCSTLTGLSPFRLSYQKCTGQGLGQVGAVCSLTMVIRASVHIKLALWFRMDSIQRLPCFSYACLPVCPGNGHTTWDLLSCSEIQTLQMATRVCCEP